MPINNIVVSGNLGKDAVLRVTPNGKHIATFSIPAKSGFGDKEKTSWMQCKMFGAMAEKLTGYLHKGSKVTVVGEFTLEEWTKETGEKVQTPTILVRDIDLPPKRGDTQEQQSSQQQDFDDSIPF
jgi:single-strand DNA-binding protein